MNQILVRTWQFLRQNRILLGPVAIETLIILFFSGGIGIFDGNPISTMAFFFLHQALLGGWLYQMKIVLLERSTPASWDDFFEGVARYFWPMLAGASMFFLLLMLILSICSLVAEAWLGPLDMNFLEKLGTHLQSGFDPVKLQAFLEPHQAAVSLVYQWSLVFMGGAMILMVIAALTSFWQQYCVMGNSNWLAAWKNSKDLILKHPGQISYLGLLWFLPTVILQLMLVMGNPVLQVLAFGLDFLLKAYFTLLFTHAILLLDPDKVTPLNQETKPEGTP